MSFNKIKKVILGLIVFFTIYKTVHYFYIKSESIKYYFIEQEIKKISDEYNKIISGLVAEWKNNLAFLEKDNVKTHHELDEVKEDNAKTHQELDEVKEDNAKTHQKLSEIRSDLKQSKENNVKTHKELAEINNAIKSMMSLMQKGLS